MYLVKLAKQLTLITTAATCLAGTAAAYAHGPRPSASGGASLTGLTPSVPAQAPVAIPPAAKPSSLPAPAPPAPAIPPPAASNTTTQTITQVQVSTCVSHCDGESQVQRAQQDNTTVQAVGAPAPHDGGVPVGLPPPTTTRTSRGATQVQVGCLAHCYGTTTLDTSGLKLAQVEHLLGELHVPTPATPTATPGREQNAANQTAAQSERNDRHQSQRARQINRTIQVVVTPVTAPADEGSGAVAVNQTAQRIVQLQVGCIFYCSRTRQTQRAQQSNATVQSVDGAGATPVNTVSRVVWQVQVGCLAWCHDAVETQTATRTDSTVVAVAPPAEVPSAAVPPAHAAPPPVVSASPRTSGARRRDTGGAPVRAPHATAVSVSDQERSGTALISVVASQTVQIQLPRRPAHRVHRVSRHRPTAPRRRAVQLANAQPRAGAVARSSNAEPSLELAAVLVLAALGFGVWCRRSREMG
jgi:hypothetical protein